MGKVHLERRFLARSTSNIEKTQHGDSPVNHGDFCGAVELLAIFEKP